MFTGGIRKMKIGDVVYIISVALQLAGALVLLLNQLTKQDIDETIELERATNGFGMTLTKTKEDAKEKLRKRYEIGYLTTYKNKFAFSYLVAGYGLGSFADAGGDNKLGLVVGVGILCAILVIIADRISKKKATKNAQMQNCDKIIDGTLLIIYGKEQEEIENETLDIQENNSDNNQKEDNQESVENKVENNFWFKHSSKWIAILTTASTALVFMLQGFFYLYEWGFASALGIDRSYIETGNMGNVFWILSYIGMAVLLFFSNFLVYLLWCNRKKWLIIGLIAAEVLSLYIGVFIYGNISPLSLTKEIIDEEIYGEFIAFVLETGVHITILNLFGMFMGIVKMRSNKTVSISEESDDKKAWIMGIAVSVVLFIIIEGLTAFLSGANVAHKKEVYKLIINDIGEENLNDGYIFALEDGKYKIDVVLYENKEEYIISPLFHTETEYIIDIRRQQVISKQNINVIYCGNLSAKFASHNENILENLSKEIYEIENNCGDE